jgi:hypothetical protein
VAVVRHSARDERTSHHDSRQRCWYVSKGRESAVALMSALGRKQTLQLAQRSKWSDFQVSGATALAEPCSYGSLIAAKPLKINGGRGKD